MIRIGIPADHSEWSLDTFIQFHYDIAALTTQFSKETDSWLLRPLRKN
jgi:hypothetical protein